MKKIILQSLLLLSLFNTITKLNAQCTFDVVGTTSVSTTSALSDMAIAPNNKVYTVAYNITSGNIELKSAFTASTSWTLNASITTTTSVKPVIKIRNDGKIYVFIHDEIANVGKVYSSTGGAFTQIGVAVSTGSVSDLSIAFNSIGEEYIAFTDYTNSTSSTVMRFFGGTWVNIGTTGLPSNSHYNSLVLDNTDNPVLAFRDMGNGYKISVMKLSGSNWVPVTGTGVVSTNQGTNSVLKVASNGNFYLGYTETTDEAIVQIYNGSVWTPLGSPVAGLLSTANSFDFDLDPTDIPNFIAIPNTSYYPTAYKYVAGTWTTVATGTINNSNNNTNPTIDIDNTGTPYYSYVDISSPNNDLYVKTLASPISISTQPLAVQTICNGSSGSFSVGVAGGVPTYQWQSASAGPFVNAGAPYINSTTSLLSFTANPAINQNKIRCVVNVGCKNIISNTSTLTVAASPTVNLTTNPPTCFGTCNGMITANPIGGAGPYTYSWSPSGGLSPTASALCAGTYSVLVKDVNNCSASANTNLIAPSGISSSVSGNLTICSGNSTTLTLTAAGGTPGYAYSWSPGASLNTTTTTIVVATPTATQIYTATVTDANGCVKSTTVTVTVNPLPALTITNPSPIICMGGSSSLAVTGANTYTWNPGGITGAFYVASPASNTTYTVIGTNTLTGCTKASSTSIIVNPNPIVTVISNPTVICAGFSATLTASGAISYTWNPGGLTATTITVSPASNIVYTVTGSTGGCANTKTLSLTVNANPIATANTSGSLTCSTITVALTSGAVAGGTYLWSGPSFTSTLQNPTTNLAGSYTVLVTSSGTGCSSSAVTSVTQNTTTPITNTTVSGVLNCTLTSVNASATTTASPVTYNWTGSGIISGATTGTINVNAGGIKNYTVTNTSNGCVTTGSLNVSQNILNTTPTASSSGTITCLTGTVQLNGTPASGVTYTWTGSGFSGGVNSQNAIATSSGIYTLSTTFISSACTNAATVAVIQNLTVPTTSASTNGTMTCTTSTVNLNSTLAGMNYTWTAPGGGNVSSSNTQNTIGSGAGTYSLTVVNPANGCLYLTTTSVSQNTTMPNGVSAGSNQTLTCSSPSVNLNGSVSTPTNASINWTGGVCGSPTNITTTACSGGVYTLTATHPLTGCYVTSTVQVIVDASIPTVTLSSNTTTITCSNPISGIFVSSTITAVDYNWTPSSGIISGTETTASPSFSAPGTYSLIVTNTLTGCASNISSNIVSVFQDQSIPTVTLSSNSVTLTCSTPSIMITSTVMPSSNVIYSWSPGTGISSPTNQANATFTAAGAFSLVVTNTVNGCVSPSNTCMILADNTPPSLTVAGNTNICKGSTTNLTANGATSYTWDSGANTASITITPTITTSYTVYGTGSNGCMGMYNTVVNIIASKSISGTITNTIGTTSGDIILYKYTAALSRWDSVTITPLTSSYSFSNIDSALYVVRAIPTATNIQVTYGTSSISWQNATVITHGCSNNSNQDITLIPLTPFTMGAGILTGTITEASGFGHRMSNEFKPLSPGAPIGGIVVKGGRNPGGQMLVQTTTNAAGQYTLQGLPVGNDYFVFVDIPGLDTNGTYHIVITSGNTQISGLNFTVDSIYINPIGSVTAITQEKSILDNKILIFPNPAKQRVSIQYELIQSANVQIELYDVIGNKIKTITEVNHQEKNKYSHIVNLENLSSGIYFVKLKINSSETIIKLVVTE